jgi:CheY-like chemotaxis protein
MDAEPLRLLAVEDDPADSAWLVQLLEQSSVCPYHLSFVLTMADAEMSLEVGEVDCVLLDLSLPDSWGLESIRRILSKAPSVPVVVITGANDQEQGLSAIELGAHDYLEKRKVSGDGILRAARWATARARVTAERAGSAGGGLAEVRAPWARLGPDLVVASASPALLDLVGRPESAVAGGPFSALVDAADDEPVRELLTEVIEGRRLGGVVRATIPGAGDEATRLLAVAPHGDGLAVLVLEPG